MNIMPLSLSLSAVKGVVNNKLVGICAVVCDIFSFSICSYFL